MSRDNPAESKLFCMEVVQGAPLLIKELETPLKTLLDAKSAVIIEWIEAGKLKPVDPIHLIFSIWAITQHYADFSVQIKAVTGKDLSDPAFFESTLSNIQHYFRRAKASVILDAWCHGRGINLREVFWRSRMWRTLTTLTMVIVTNFWNLPVARLQVIATP